MYFPQKYMKISFLKNLFFFLIEPLTSSIRQVKLDIFLFRLSSIGILTTDISMWA